MNSSQVENMIFFIPHFQNKYAQLILSVFKYRFLISVIFISASLFSNYLYAQVLDSKISTPITENSQPSNQFYNKDLSDLVISKNVKKGVLTINYKIGYRAAYALNCQFLIRLFDSNGNYLTHIITKNQYEIYGPPTGRRELSYKKEIEYDVNIQFLRDADRAQFGFYVCR